MLYILVRRQQCYRKCTTFLICTLYKYKYEICHAMHMSISYTSVGLQSRTLLNDIAEDDAVEDINSLFDFNNYTISEKYGLFLLVLCLVILIFTIIYCLHSFLTNISLSDCLCCSRRSEAVSNEEETD